VSIDLSLTPAEVTRDGSLQLFGIIEFPEAPIDCDVAEGTTWGAILLTADAPRRHTVSPGTGDRSTQYRS
jgi:hypothetical protein